MLSSTHFTKFRFDVEFDMLCMRGTHLTTRGQNTTARTYDTHPDMHTIRSYQIFIEKQATRYSHGIADCFVTAIRLDNNVIFSGS